MWFIAGTAALTTSQMQTALPLFQNGFYPSNFDFCFQPKLHTILLIRGVMCLNYLETAGLMVWNNYCARERERERERDGGLVNAWCLCRSARSRLGDGGAPAGSVTNSGITSYDCKRTRGNVIISNLMEPPHVSCPVQTQVKVFFHWGDDG